MNGSSLQLYVGGVLEVSTTNSAYASGKIGFSSTNALAWLDNVVVTSLSGSQNATKHATSAVVSAAVNSATTGGHITSLEALYGGLMSLLSQINQHHGLG